MSRKEETGTPPRSNAFPAAGSCAVPAFGTYADAGRPSSVAALAAVASVVRYAAAGLPPSCVESGAAAAQVHPSAPRCTIWPAAQLGVIGMVLLSTLTVLVAPSIRMPAPAIRGGGFDALEQPIAAAISNT